MASAMQSLEAGFCMVQKAETDNLLYGVTVHPFLNMGLANNIVCCLALLALSQSPTWIVALEISKGTHKRPPSGAYLVTRKII